MESVASRHIGLSVSSGQMRYALQRLWNPRTEKGLLATLRQGAAVKLVAELLREADKFFDEVETACEEIQQPSKPSSKVAAESDAAAQSETRLDRIAHPPTRTGEGQCHAADSAIARSRQRTHQNDARTRTPARN